MNPIPASTLDLLARYDRPGPRYTSYPTAIEFNEGFSHTDYVDRLAAADKFQDVPLSLYVHLPFCEERCLYCGCNVIITKHRNVAEKYLDHLCSEIDLLAGKLPHRRRLSQMHWGGGTPTYYSPDQLEQVHRTIAGHFDFTDDAEVGIEVDPRVTTEAHVTRLRELGFNRFSMGVQDFAADVQEAVHRVQSYEMTRGLVEQARANGFDSTNIDLIYGLPYQTVEGFSRTLEQVIEIRPERVAVYSFAFVPWIKAHMNHLPDESLPGPSLKLELLGLTIDAFTAAGYRHIGMDHFAVPEDELAQAIEKRTLNRNFMGYTVQSTRDTLAVGISSIGDVQGAFVQNVKKLPTYYEAIEAGRFPVERGFALNQDDVIRRDVIMRIMCNSYLDVREVERAHDIVFAEYFSDELQELTCEDSPERHGLLTVTPEALELTPTGRLFVRNVAMVFDRYLESRMDGQKPVFSRTV